MPRPERPAEPPRRWLGPLRIVLLCFSCLIPLLLMRGKSATFDEVAHLPAGYSYLTTGLVNINPQHPPLIKEICAVPLLFLGAKLPVDPETLRRSPVSLTYQWGFGKKFLYSQDADRLLFWGRVPAVLLSVGLATLVMLWASRLWGGVAGLLALFLYAFDPTLTAHAQLVTTDVGLACFATLFLFLLRRYLAAPSWGRLLPSGLALGLALGAKFSGVALIPMAALLIGMTAWRGRQSEPARAGTKGRGTGNRGEARGRPTILNPLEGNNRSARVLSAAGTLAVLAVLAAAVLWAIYFFPADPLFYLRGMEAVNRDHSSDYLPFLMGEMRPGGWKSYLLVAWLIKTPIPSLILLFAAVVLFLRGRRSGWLDEAFLLIPALGFFAGYSLTADNLGVRYLIPCFPFFFIFTARIIPALRESRIWAKGAVILLLTWYVGEFAAVTPDHLSYFNEIAGGSRNGSLWLDDSNLDWGQGLIQLRDYLGGHPVPEYRFCYFGSGDPGYYGIRGQPINVRALTSRPPPGILILSAHCVARARAEMALLHGEGAANWLAHSAPKTVVGHAYYIYEIR